MRSVSRRRTPRAATSNISDATQALRWGISAGAARLNERLGALRDGRWRPMPDGHGLLAVDQRGRPVATLWLEDAGLGQPIRAEGDEHGGEQRQSQHHQDPGAPARSAVHPASLGQAGLLEGLDEGDHGRGDGAQHHPREEPGRRRRVHAAAPLQDVGHAGLRRRRRRPRLLLAGRLPRPEIG